jgi:hypothetical protein
MDEEISSLQATIEEKKFERENLELQISRIERESLFNDYLIAKYLEANVKYEDHVKGTDYFYKLGIILTGAFSDTNQRCMSLKFNSFNKNELRLYLDTFERVSKFIKPLIDGTRMVKLMEPNLSEYGSFYIEEREGVYYLTKTIYARTFTVFQTDFLPELFEYCNEHYSFERD